MDDKSTKPMEPIEKQPTKTIRSLQDIDLKKYAESQKTTKLVKPEKSENAENIENASDASKADNVPKMTEASKAAETEKPVVNKAAAVTGPLLKTAPDIKPAENSKEETSGLNKESEKETKDGNGAGANQEPGTKKETEATKEAETKKEAAPIKRSSNFLIQGSILAIASIVSRFIGLLYRLPMTDIIGDMGNSYYASAYELYNVMLIISSYSLPLAVSKLVSTRMADDNKRMAYKVLKGALLFALCSGSLVAFIVWFGADFFASSMLKTPMSFFALRVLAPVLIVVAILGVIRGFFQGMGNMVYSAVSQIIEQIVNAIVSIWAAYVLFNYGAKVGAVLNDVEHYSAAYGAAGGTLGTNLGAVAGLIFMTIVLILFLKQFKKDMEAQKNGAVETFREIMYTLMMTIIPVLLSSTIYNISGITDQVIFKNTALVQGYDHDRVDVWWGVYTGKYKLMINVPLAIANAMAASSVPTLTRSFKSGQLESVREQIGAVMRFVMVIAFPCAAGLAFLAKPIFLLLFSSTASTADIAASMMYVGAIAVVFYAMSTLSNGILQGIDRMLVPVKNAAIALVIHIFLIVILMVIFRIHIYAVVIANAAFALIMCVLNARSVAIASGYKQEFYRTFILPAGCSLLMGVCAAAVYKLMYALCHINAISFGIAFMVAVAVYAVSMLLTKGLTEAELLKFPKGTLLVKLFKKVHLL